MNNKKPLLIVGIIVIIALIIVVAAMSSKKKATVVTTPNTQTAAQTSSPIVPAGAELTKSTTTAVVDQFRTDVPKDIIIPEVGQKLTDAQKKVIAVPTVVTAAAPGASTKFRSYDISANGGKFEPSQIIGRVGDTIHVNFTAVDKGYDIVFPSYNMKQVAAKGETKILEFQAVQEGSFTYYCDSCGGVNSTAKGTIIIAQ